jgi:hypothetical protein
MEKVELPSGGTLFEERQHFPRWLLLVVALPAITSVVLFVIMGLTKNMEPREMTGALLILVPLESLSVWIFVVVQLETVVTTDGLYYRWTVIQKKFRRFPREAMEKMEMQKAPALKYGYSNMPGFGKIWNMNNGTGVRLYLSDGSKLFFGTADTAGLERAVEQMMGRNRLERAPGS